MNAKTTILLLTALASGLASFLLVGAIGNNPSFWGTFLQVIGFIIVLAICGASLNKLEKLCKTGKN